MKIKRESFVDVYITEALLSLLEKKEYKDISITEICKKAGVTRKSFYRNFESREDILFKKVRNVTDSFLKESAISYRNDTVSEYFVKLFTHMERHKELCTALHKAGLIHIVKDDGTLHLHKEIAPRLQKASLLQGLSFRSDKPVHFATGSFFCCFIRSETWQTAPLLQH